MQTRQKYLSLFETVSNYIEIPESDKLLCYQYFQPVSFPKNTIVEEIGKIPGYQYFIISGIMRNYYFNDSGEEVTTDLNNESRFFTSYNNFVHQRISYECIECVSACELLRIKRKDVDILYDRSTILKDFTILLLEKVFEEERNRIRDLTVLTAEQRYIKFICEKPNIIHTVPLQYIASYLGIKPETLSRIRRKIIS